MDHVGFSIEAKPVPAARPKVSKFGVYYPKAHTVYKNMLESMLPQFLTTTLDQPMEVRMMFVVNRYKTSDYPTIRADVDNLAKLPLDCMTTCKFWTDDALVVALVSMKRFCRVGEVPHTKVRVIAFDGDVESHVDRLFNS